MKTYATVEDYLEVLAGMRDVVTGKTVNTWLSGFDPIISLARYDVDVLTTMSEATSQGKALTERQATLLTKILLKYQRQLANKSIDVSPVENPIWRKPLRKMDYSQRVYIDDDKLVMHFPFQNKLIEELRSFKSSSQGTCVFDREKKVWQIGLTEYNLNWVYTWAQHNKFEIDQQVHDLNNLILEMENTPFAIELYYGPESLDITNCPSSLREYIEENMGGFGYDNLLRLVDASSVLGYTIESALSEAVLSHWGNYALTIASHRELRIDPTAATVEDDFAKVLGYAVTTNRLPVVIYEPDLSNRLLAQLTKLYPSEDIYSVGVAKRPVIPPTAKFIHTVKPIRAIERVPMLVTSAGMIFGGDKQIMTQRSEKIVYFAADVYNATGGPGNKTRKVVRLS